VTPDRVTTLKLTVAHLEAAVASSERSREDMLFRRRSATDSMMVLLDHRLEHNARTLRSLKRGLEVLKLELLREEKKRF
jgi:hypothetical protein